MHTQHNTQLPAELNWSPEEWNEWAGALGDPAPGADLARTVENDRGAPATPGWP